MSATTPTPADTAKTIKALAAPRRLNVPIKDIQNPETSGEGLSMASSSNTQPKPRPLPRPKAGEAIAVYGGLPSGACAARLQMTARERAQVDRALALVGRQLRMPGEALSNPQCSKDYFRLAIGAEPVEHFCVLFLDSQHRGIAFERMFTGTLTQTSVYPRELARSALRHNAAAVLLGHNHPSGSTTPSRGDEALTQTLKSALALVDVRVLDHIIVTPGAALSMAEMGLV